VEGTLRSRSIPLGGKIWGGLDLGCPAYSILTGRLYVWVEDFDSLKIASQFSCVRLAQSALSRGCTVIEIEDRVLPLVGLAVGRGAREELVPVKMSVEESNYPLFSCSIVCTNGRVAGIPGELGYFGDVYSSRSRRWVFSFNKELGFWRQHLRLPKIWGMGAATFRLTSPGDKIKTRTEIYKEIQAQTKRGRRR
jgi:hypothetical protein